MAKRRPLLRFLIWLMALCAFSELALRLFGYGSYVQYRPDQQLLWVPEPGRNKLTVVNHQRITINDEGFRYPTDLGPKQPGQYRIFSFGDSVTMGWGVDDQSHYSAFLEKFLNSDNCQSTHVQVVSAGVNAYPNSLVAERVKTVINDRYQPDIAIVAYSFNTGFESFPLLKGAERQKFLRRVMLKSIARHSAIYNFLIEDLLRQVAYYRFRELLMQGTWNTARQRPDDNVAGFVNSLQQELSISRSHHVQTIFLLLASEHEDENLHPYQRAMLDFAQANGVPIVNMVDILRLQDQRVLFMDHVHPTAAGHEKIAEALAQTVRGTNSYETACKGAAKTAVADLAHRAR
jgi:lysophospholipase L1-like esterase